MKPPENPLQKDVDALVEHVMGALDRMPSAPPFGMVRVPEAQQLDEYVARSNTPEFWQRIIEERGEAEAVRYARAMAKKLAKRPVVPTATDATR